MFDKPQADFPAHPPQKSARGCCRLSALVALAVITLGTTSLPAYWGVLDQFPQRPPAAPRGGSRNNNNNSPPAPQPVQNPTPTPDPDPTPPPAPVISPEELARQKRHADAMALDTTGCDAFDKRDWPAAAKAFGQALESEPDDQVLRNNLAIAEHWEGSEAAQKGDLATAIKFYQMALAAKPENTAALKSQLAAAEKQLQDQKEAKALSGAMRENLRVFAQMLEPLPPMAQPLVIPGNDTSVVDTRNNPADLPQDVEKAIRGAYPHASDEVTGRLYKGFQQLAKHDWHAANAWFEDALNQEPGNAGLKSFVEAAQSTMDRTEKSTTLHPVQIGDLVPPPPREARGAYAPSKSELEDFLMLLSPPKSRTLPPSTSSPPRD